LPEPILPSIEIIVNLIAIVIYILMKLIYLYYFISILK